MRVRQSPSHWRRSCQSFEPLEPCPPEPESLALELPKLRAAGTVSAGAGVVGAGGAHAHAAGTACIRDRRAVVGAMTCVVAAPADPPAGTRCAPTGEAVPSGARRAIGGAYEVARTIRCSGDMAGGGGRVPEGCCRDREGDGEDDQDVAEAEGPHAFSLGCCRPWLVPLRAQWTEGPRAACACPICGGSGGRGASARRWWRALKHRATAGRRARGGAPRRRPIPGGRSSRFV